MGVSRFLSKNQQNKSTSYRPVTKSYQIDTCIEQFGDPKDKEWEIMEIKGRSNSYNSFQILTYQPKQGLDSVSHWIKITNTWEEHNTKLILQNLESLKNLNPDKRVIFVDAGANIGWFSLAVASKGYKVISFEPLSSSVYAIKYAKCMNPWGYNIQLNEFGIGMNSSECILYSEYANTQNGWVKCDDKPLPGIKREVVPIRTLDSLVGTIPSNSMLGVMKMDIEGFEYFAFQGAQKFFSIYKIPYIVIEFEPVFFQRLNYSAQDLIDLIHRTGYDIRVGGWDGAIIMTYKELTQRYYKKQYEEVYLTLQES